MALPTPPVAAGTVASAPVAQAAPAASNSDGKVKLKKFGAARVGEGEAATLVPTPTAGGLNLVDLSKAFYNTLVSEASKAGIKIDDILGFCGDADKSQFPGHKDGRIAYATANTVASIGKINGLLNKVRGLGGGAAMKAKIAEKDTKIQALEAQLAALMEQLGKKA